jgi:hypothetical protein
MLRIGTRGRWAALGVISAVLGGGMWAPAQASPGDAALAPSSSFVSFDSFLATTAQARYPSYAAHGLAGTVHTEQAFNEMRDYVLHQYQGVRVNHSYRTDGSYFDCVTTTSQPTVHALGIKKIASPPPVAGVGAAHPGPARNAGSILNRGLNDDAGNAIGCGVGTIPMQRLSLDRLTKFNTLRDFMAKPATANAGNARFANAHRYATGRQYVNNLGGNSWLNLWNPSGEFSISQQWYGTGSGTTTQTVEGGWIHYPGKFGAQSVLFIFSTPDGYAHGCYNLDCTGFVQTNRNWSLGGKFNNYSTYGGQQWGFTMQWKLSGGNWWLFLQGSGALEAVGYYPGSTFNGGEMSRNATRATYGGETYTGGTNWPQMGSGKFANAGFAQAAYQNMIFYIDTANASQWASLGASATNPACYTILYTPASSGGSWGTNIYFGGPGGTC